VPGIVGLITAKPPAEAMRELRLMVQTLRHESFYAVGTWSDESLGVYVGWIARKGSFADGMPVSTEKDDVVLTFSGEDYPDPDVIARLKEKGHAFCKGPSYLVHTYEEDPSFPANLNGRFHGLLVDRNHGTALLFNDRYGMHRIYYHEGDQAFYFAAEAKAILAVRPELRKLDAQGLGELVSCGCVLENRTIFEGIKVLPPASAWTFRARALERRATYFQPREWEEQETLDTESYYQVLRDAFSKNLRRYFNGQERVGMSLTGGLDTRMIMAWQKPPAGSLPCYTFGGTMRECRDVIVGRQIAHACGQSHEVVQTGIDFLARFPYYAERTVYLSDGCAGVNFSPVLSSNEKARSFGGVRMTGNYGDQVLRRLRAFGPDKPNDSVFSRDFLKSTDTAVQTYAGVVQRHPLSFVAFCQAPWYFHALLTLENTQVTVRSPFMDNDVVRTNYRAPESTCRNNDLRVRLIHDGDPALGQIRTDLGFGGKPGFSGALSRKYNEFTMRAEYAYDYGMPQWVARIDHLLTPFHLERLFLGRHKYYHFRIWYRNGLSKFVREILLDPRSLNRGYVERIGVERMVQDHVDGRRNYTSEIHKLLTLELIHRLFIETN